MDEIELNQYLIIDDSIMRLFNGIIGSNELCMIENNKRSLYIVNTDPNYLPGSHWICVYVDNDTCEIFDSLGNNPSKYNKYFKDFMDKYKKCSYSISKLQDIKSKMCGAYCVYYCYLKSRNFKLSHIIETFSKDNQMKDYLISTFLYKLYK